MHRYKKVLTLTILFFILSLTVVISRSKEEVFSKKESPALNMETQVVQLESHEADGPKSGDGDEFVQYCPYYVTSSIGSLNGNEIKVGDIICFNCPTGANPLCPRVNNIIKKIKVIVPDGHETYTITLSGNGGGCIACPTNGRVVNQSI